MMGPSVQSWITLILIHLLTCTAVTLGAQPKGEFDVKATFLYNLPSFVRWPEGTFETPQSPIVIGILGEDPFGPVIDSLVDGEQVDGRPLEVRRLRSLHQISSCHILFISGSEGRRIRRILSEARRYPILTVADWSRFLDAGGAVELVTIDRRLRLEIQLERVHEADLILSSKLLRIAHIVGEEGYLR